MSYSLPETDTGKILYQTACKTRQKPLISGKCVMGISCQDDDDDSRQQARSTYSLVVEVWLRQWLMQ